MNVTSSTSAISSQTGTNSPRTRNDELGKSEFLKLLITQLQHQDPLQPMEDKEFIAQMAQFSTLEQMQNMNSSVIATQATAMINKTISWAGDDGEEYIGVVSAVRIIEGQPKLVVEAQLIDMKKVLSISGG